MAGNKRKLTIGIDASRAFVKDPAGPEYYSWHIIQNIAKVDKKNQYILYLRPKQRPNFKLPKNFKRRVIKFPYLWTQVGLLISLILKPIDILFVPAHTLPLLAKIFCPKLKIVVTIHGLEGKYLPQTGLIFSHIYRNWSIGWAIRFADKLLAVSDNTRTNIIKTYKNHSKNIKTIHEGVDKRFFKTFKRSYINRFLKRKNLSANYILFVGTLQPRKNLIRLIRAFANIIKSDGRLGNSGINPGSLSLVIVGKPGWLYHDILSAPADFGIKGRVKFLGRVEDSDLPLLYQGANFFVLPSLTEGFGLPVLEAQASGLLCVLSSSGALREVSGGLAIFVNPRSVKDIQAGLENAINNKENKREKARFIKEGRGNAHLYSWKETAYSTVKYLVSTRDK